MENLLHLSPEDLFRISISAFVIYLLVITSVQIVGKRSTSQMNSFDWIVTVAIGSIVGSTIIVKDISILQGGLSIVVLFAMQLALTKLIYHSPLLKKLVKSSPTVLLYDGSYLKKNMEKERIVQSEINSAIRQQGIANISEVFAVVLETDAKMSVIPKNKSNIKNISALKDIEDLSAQLNCLQKDAPT